jgi:hypothetical protein
MQVEEAKEEAARAAKLAWLPSLDTFRTFEGQLAL